jgi:hypothetical protein
MPVVTKEQALERLTSEVQEKLGADELPEKLGADALSWAERLELQLLRREAEALLAGSRPKK